MNRLKLLSLLPAFVFGACHNHDAHGDHDEHNHEAEEAAEHHDHAPGIIHLEPEDAARLGVSAEGIVRAPFRDAVKVTAEVLPSAADMATASAPTAGIITYSAGITRGSEVKAGQVIARVSATKVSGGDANTAAKVAIDNAKRELDRLTPLLEDGLVTRREYNEALAAYESAKAAYSPAAASGTVKAPRSGVVTEIIAAEGAFVETGAPVATVSGSGSLTLRALLPASEASMLPKITGAVIAPHSTDSQAIDLSIYGGRLLSTASSSSTETPGYIPVYFTFKNTAPVVAGSAAEAYLIAGEREGVLSVPVGAISEQMGEKFVFIKRDAEDYEKAPVTLGRSDGMRVEVLKGVAEGDSVVVRGTSFVRLAEQSTVVPEGHSHNH